MQKTGQSDYIKSFKNHKQSYKSTRKRVGKNVGTYTERITIQNI